MENMQLPLNLRTAPDGSLRPVGDPPMAWNAAQRPIHYFTHPGGGVSRFMSDGSMLTVQTPGGRHQILLSPLAGDLLLTDAPGGDGVLVMAPGATTASASPMLLVTDGDSWSRAWESDMPEAPLLTAQPVAVLEQAMPGRKLSAPLTSSARAIATTDLARLSADFRDAYDALKSRADALGAYIQPVVARCRLEDPWGQTVLATAPVLLTPTDTPLSCTVVDRAVGSEGGEITAVQPDRLKATAFRVAVIWPSGTVASARVARAVVEICRPLDPFREGRCPSRVTFGSNAAMLRLAMPGTGLDGGVPGHLCSAVVATAASMDRSAANAGVIIPGSDRTWPGLTLCGSDCPPPARAVHAGRFTAATACMAGNVTLWGDITTRRPMVPSPAAFATDLPREDTTWSGSTMVTFDNRDTADGNPERVVGTFRGSGVPGALSPLVCYPDAGATAIRIAVGSRYVELPLQPSPDGSMAYYLDPGLAAISFRQGQAAVVPADNPAQPPRFPGRIIVTDPERPLAPLCEATVPGGRVTAIVPAARGRSSWDFGRSHFYALTTSGIYALAVNSARTRVDMALIDTRDAMAGVLTPDGVMAVAGRSLLRLNASAVTDVATLPISPDKAGWNAAMGELWLADADGVTLVGDTAWKHPYRRSLPVTALLPLGGELMVTSGTTTMRAGATEVTGVPTPVRAEFAVDAPRGRPGMLEWPLTAAEFDGTLSLRADGGHSAAMRATVLRLDVSGALNCPVKARVLTPPRRRYTALLDAVVSHDAVIAAPVLGRAP